MSGEGNAFYQSQGRIAVKGEEKGKQSMVPNFKLYKAGRAEEVTAYRNTVRVFTMHFGTNLPKAQLRILEDLREVCQIDQTRHELELADARADAGLEGIRKSGVLSNRTPYFDGVNDVPPPPPTVDEDDAAGLATITYQQVGGSRKAVGGAAAGRGTATKKAARPQTPNQLLPAVSPVQLELKALAEEIKQLCRALVVAPTGPQRNDLQQKLLDQQSKLEELRQKRQEELAAAPPR